MVKEGNITILYIEKHISEFRKNCAHGAIGIILAAGCIWCLTAAQKMGLSYEEKIIEHTGAPAEARELTLLFPKNWTDILNENIKEGKQAFELSDANLPGPLEIPAVNTGLSAVTDSKEKNKAGMTAALGPEHTENKNQAVKEELPAVSFTYTGELGMDYCVGSELDFSGIVLQFDGGTVNLYDCVITGADTSAAGDKKALITYREHTVEIPYRVVDYTAVLHPHGQSMGGTAALLWNYGLLSENTQIPICLGKEFTGWYRDAQCSIPFTGAKRGEYMLDLYAGWKDYDNYRSDENGYLTAFTGTASDITDYTLSIPSHKGCVGIASGTFSTLGTGIYDVYIPSNILYIAPDAFDTLSELIYIEVHADNPNYCSIEGCVYTKDQSELIISPKGREGWQ